MRIAIFMFSYTIINCFQHQLFGFTGFERFCSQGSFVALSGEVTFFSFLCIIIICDKSSYAIMDLAPTWENITMVSSTLTKQMSLAPSAITIDMTKTQPSNIFVVNSFHFDAIESKGPTNVNWCCDECRRERGENTFVTRIVAHNCTRRPIHDSIIWLTKIYRAC